MNRRRHQFDSYEHYKNCRNSGSSPRRRPVPETIKYQDDSLSSLDSDSDVRPRATKIKKEPPEPCSSSIDNKSTSDHEERLFVPKPDHHKDKHQKHNNPRRSNDRRLSPRRHFNDRRKSRSRENRERKMESPTTRERLERLECMLEKLIKRNDINQLPTNPHDISSVSPVEKNASFVLEPRDHSFTTSMWLIKIQEVSIANNWDEKSTISFMESQMTGIIKAWYNSLPNQNHFTWPEWKLLISKTFPDNTEFVITLKRLVTRLRQANESVTNYYFSKMYLLEACKITGEDAVSCLIDGLNNRPIQTQAKLPKFITPETFYTEFLTTLPDYEIDYTIRRHSILDNESRGLNGDGQSDRHKLDNELRQVKFERELIVYSSPEPPLEPAPRRSSGSGTIHSRLDYGYKFQTKPYTKICGICFKKGHLAKYCRDKVMTMTEQANDHENCLKICTINGRFKVEGLIDTGSSVVTITEDIANEMGKDIGTARRRNREIIGFGGNSTSVLGEMDLTLSVDGVIRNVTSLVVSKKCQHVPVIVGHSFLSQNRVGMILTNGKASIIEK